MKIINLKDYPQYVNEAIEYYIHVWGSKDTENLYRDSIKHGVTSNAKLPQWYIMIEKEKIIG